MRSDSASTRHHLAAVWMADIVGYSLMASENEDRALRLVAQFQRQARAAVAEQGGRIVKFVGDAALAEFPGTEQAAIAAHRLCLAGAPDLQLRVGLHVGDLLRTSDGDLLGDGVNVAARLQTTAEPGQILLSEAAFRQLRHREGFQLEDTGPHALKGQQGTSNAWALLLTPASGDEAADDSSRGLAWATKGGWRQAAHRLGRKWTGSPSASKRAAMLLVAAAASIALILGLQLREGTEGAPGDYVRTSALDPARIAVLYLDDHSPARQLGYLADGLTEALIHQLSQVERLDVVSRNGVKPFRDGAVGLDSIANHLRAGSIVEGSVAQSEGQIRVTVQLIDGASGTHLFSRVIEAGDGELFALQDRVVREVAEGLRRRLGEEIRLRELRHATSNEAAYELMLRGNALREEYLAVRLVDMDSGRKILLRADSLLQAASALDPNWPDPLIARGLLLRQLARDSGPLPQRADPELASRALVLAERALSLDGSNGAALELRGLLRYEQSRLTQGDGRSAAEQRAEQDLRDAVTIDPSRAAAWWTLSNIQLERGHFAEAKLSAEQALQADAFLEYAAAVLHQIYYAAVQMGPTDDARAACDEGRRRFPDSDEFISCQLFILASFPGVEPDLERARQLVDSLVAVVARANAETFRAFGTMMLAQVAARAGESETAFSLIHAARGDSVVGWLAYNEAHARLQLGERDRAIELLTIYLDFRPDTAIVAKDWWFEELHAEPAFRELVGAGP